MASRTLAGRFAPRGAGGALLTELEAALRRDGPAESIALGPLSVAWTPPDPPGGAHPLCVLDGTPATARLAGELRLDPASSPEEVVLAGWRTRGDAVLDALAGEFALLVWDPERRRGLLARDRLGMRPLFTAEVAETLVFASEVRNLLALLPSRPAPDRTAMIHWLASTRVSEGRTLYEGVTRLRAGHAIALGDDGWHTYEYWRPRYAHPRKIGADDATVGLRAAVDAAVARALTDARRPAVMLSGGLDSSAVAATVARTAAAPPSTYSVVFPGDPAVDEGARIGAVRERVGLAGVELPFAQGSALAAAEEFQREWELPSATPNVFIWLPLLRRAAADGVDVVLDGEGGDELFGCARYLVADRLRAGRPLAALGVARRLPGMGDAPRPRWLARALATYGLRAALPRGLHEPLRRLRDGTPAWLAGDAAELHRSADDPWHWKRTAAPRWWAQLADAIAGDGLGAADQLRREGGLAGVELRHPLRSSELVDLVLRLPPELSFDPHLDRPLLRRAFAGELPDELLACSDKPAFNTLLDSALGERELVALRALLSDPHPELARLVRVEHLRALLARPRAARTWALDMWRLVSLELWLAQQVDRIPLMRQDPPSR